MSQGPILNAFFGELPERRDSNRFPLQEELSYRVVNTKTERIAGTGRTLDMSSSGICFTTLEKLQIGRQVEVAVNWPALLDGNCALKFVAVGRVVRSDDHSAAVKIERYEFRTRGGGQSGFAKAANA
jgi:hypothetical protein